jgi:hypothetical protein
MDKNNLTFDPNEVQDIELQTTSRTGTNVEQNLEPDIFIEQKHEEISNVDIAEPKQPIQVPEYMSEVTEINTGGDYKIELQEKIFQLKSRLNQQELDEEVLSSILFIVGEDVEAAIEYLQNTQKQGSITRKKLKKVTHEDDLDVPQRNLNDSSSLRSYIGDSYNVKISRKAELAIKKETYIPQTTWDKNPEIRSPEGTSSPVTFEDLDEDTLYNILSYCDSKQYLMLGSTNRRFYEFTSRNQFWKLLLGADRVYKIKNTTSATKTRNFHNMLTFDAFRNAVNELPPSMAQRAYDKEKLKSSSLSLDEEDSTYNYKEQFAQFNKVKNLEQRRRMLMDKEREAHHAYIDLFESKQNIMWIVFLILLLIGAILSSILTPLYADNYIPFSGYYWLIGYSPVFILYPFYVILIIIHVRVYRFYPLWTRTQVDFRNNNHSASDIYNFNWIIFTLSLFIWALWLLLAVFIKLIALSEYPVWTYLMIPTYVIMFGSYVCSFPSGMHEASFKNSTKSYIIGAIGTFSVYVFFSIGIGLTAAKADGFSTMSNVSYSTIFIAYYIALGLLEFFTILVFLVLFQEPYEDYCTYACTMKFFIGHLIGYLIIAPIFSSFLLVGLRLDGITPHLPYIAALAPFYGGIIVLTILGIIIGGIIICCCILSGEGD